MFVYNTVVYNVSQPVQYNLQMQANNKPVTHDVSSCHDLSSNISSWLEDIFTIVFPLA